MKALLFLLLALQDSPIDKAARRLTDAISPSPPEAKTLFHEDFLKDVNAANLSRVLSQIHDQLGECTSLEIVADDGPWVAIAHAYFGDRSADGTRQVLPFTFSIDRAAPHLITSLRFDSVRPPRRTIEDAVEEIRRFRGMTSFQLARLGDSPIRMVAHNTDKPVAVSSTFKIAVLGALAAAQDAKDPQSWSRAIPLREELLSPGSGPLDQWKAGSPVTVHSLATLMVSQSDNTATDHLIAHLGRARVEAAAAEMGLARNKPLLTTLEAFKLKAAPDLRKQWIDGDEAARRALLDGPVKALNREDLAPRMGVLSIDSIEWFATAQELCDAMDWLRKKMESVPAVREVLSVNPGVRYRKSAWKFVGFKGGAEPGVLNLTFLLQAADGTWYAMAATWNDPKRPLDESVFTDIVQDIVYLMQKPR